MTREVASREVNACKRSPTYQTGGKCIQDMDYMFEWFHQFAVVSSKFSEGPCLILKDCGDRLDRITIFEPPGERMVDQFHPCLLFIVMQGSIEEGLDHRAGWVTHIAGLKEYGYKWRNLRRMRDREGRGRTRTSCTQVLPLNCRATAAHCPTTAPHDIDENFPRGYKLPSTPNPNLNFHSPTRQTPGAFYRDALPRYHRLQSSE